MNKTQLYANHYLVNHALKAQHNLAQWQRLGSEMCTKHNCALKGQRAKILKQTILIIAVSTVCIFQSLAQNVPDTLQIDACENAGPPYYIYTRPDNGLQVPCIGGLNTINLDANGWDSTVYINVTLKATIEYHAYREICKSEIIWFGNEIINYPFSGADYPVGETTEIQGIEVLNPYGCDTIYTLHLTVHPEYNILLEDNICLGEEYAKHGFGVPAQNIAGTFEHTLSLRTRLPLYNGCDSIITLRLTVNPPKNDTIHVAILDGETYSENGFNESVEGTYTHYGTSAAGCDSTATLILTVYQVCPTCVVNVIEANICTNNEPYYYQHHEGWLIPCVEGLQKVDSIHISNTKDSIVFVKLTVNKNPVKAIYKTLCHNETFNFHGNIIRGADYQLGNDTINFYVSHANSSECDTLFKLVLSIVETFSDTITANICQGEGYHYFGFNVTEQETANVGILYRTQNLQVYYNGFDGGCNCDSVITLILTVNPHKDTTIYAGICEGDIYSENGFNESVQGIYKDSLRTADGCDSVVILILYVYRAGEDREIVAEICEGNTYTANGFNESATGKYVEQRYTKDSCLYTLTLNLTVLDDLRMDTLLFDKEICGDELYIPVKYRVETGRIDSIFVYFDKTARNDAGFEDYVERNPNDSIIEIPLPKDIRPDNYSVTLYFDGRCSDATFTVNFTVLYPASVMEQRWNDVIVLKNPAYNGGYDFSHIEWFVDDDALAQKYIYNKGAYIYTDGNTLQSLGDRYSVCLIRKGEYQPFCSCPLKLEQHQDRLDYPCIDNTRIESDKGRFKVYSCESIVEMNLWNIYGQIIQQKHYADAGSIIEVSVNPGIYIIRIINKKNQIYTQKIIVPQ